jgi:UDP-N-acetylglucosamine acyltransferase
MNTSITMDIPAFIKVAADPARVIGLNTIGMSRSNLSEDAIAIIKKAYKLVYKKGYKLEDAIKEVEKLEDPVSSELQIFIDSIKSSERGLLR